MKCRFPIPVKMPNGLYIYVPCGHCAWCLRSFRDQWIFRLAVESRDHGYSSFVTYTYRDQDLPYSINEDTGEMVNTVSSKHVDEFHKSLRNKGYKFRYLLTSEYGSKTLRPHYHAIYFHDEPINFEKLWPHGDENVQLPAKYGSFKYVLKYVLKGSKVPEGAEPNFRRMSRRPGIGSSFVYKGQPYVITPDGVKCAVPHYYTRNYEKGLTHKLLMPFKEAKYRYLSSLERHHSLHEVFQNSTEMSPTDPGYDVAFEEWLSLTYSVDYRKQIAINKKEL